MSTTNDGCKDLFESILKLQYTDKRMIVVLSMIYIFYHTTMMYKEVTDMELSGPFLYFMNTLSLLILINTLTLLYMFNFKITEKINLIVICFLTSLTFYDSLFYNKHETFTIKNYTFFTFHVLTLLFTMYKFHLVL